MKTIYFCGDLHADIQPIQTWNREVENSTLIQVGDFGLGFNERPMKDWRRLLMVSQQLKRKNNQVFVVRGNHDDPAVFDGRRVGEFFLLKDNTLIEVEGKYIWCVGGGISIDRMCCRVDSHGRAIPRRHGLDYWNDEPFGWDKTLPTKMDVVVTHAAGNWAARAIKNLKTLDHLERDTKLFDDLMEERRQHDEMQQAIYHAGLFPQRWFFGHYHEVLHSDNGSGTVFRGLAINEIVPWSFA